MRAVRRLLLLFVLAWTLPAAAIEVAEGLTPKQEVRYRALAEELRCLVCQNQSLADSNADLATDMRHIVRRMIKDGADDATIIKYMTDRYGDFVLYRPPLKPATVLLWALPFVVLCMGIVAAFTIMRRRQENTVLSDDQREKARDLLGE